MKHRLARKEATISVVLRSGHPNSGGELPIRVAVIYNRSARYYPVKWDGRPLYMNLRTKDELKDFLNKRVKGENRKIQEAIETTKTKAIMAHDTVTHNGKPFTFEGFEKEFLEHESKKGFLHLFRDHLQQLKREERIGTYSSYKNAYTAFSKFRGAKYAKGHEINSPRELSPSDITVSMLKDFETHLRSSGAGRTTIAMYMRTIKVVYNVAADRNPTLLESYPFARKQTDRNRYKIRSGSGHKGQPLSKEQLRKFVGISTIPGLPEHEAKLLWLFSFYCQGMNMKDVFLLKYSNIQGDVIRFVRAKTKDTEDKETVMEIPLTEPVRQIIREIGNADKNPNSYVFPVIPNGLGSTIKRRTDHERTHEERIYEIIKQKTKMINARIKQLCKDSGDVDLNDLKLSTYWARHSYASLLKESGESVEMIRELLGHSDLKTTESYLRRFDVERKRKVSDKIEELLRQAEEKQESDVQLVIAKSL